MPSAGALDPLSPTATPGPAADWRVADERRHAAAYERVHREAPRRGGAGPARPGRLDRPPLVVRARPGLRDLPRGGGERHRAAVQGTQLEGARARLRRHPHPYGRLRVPRRPLPLRTSLEPVRSDGGAARLRRPLPQRRGRGRRELLGHRQPDGHAQPGGMAELRGLAARRVAHPRGHLLEVGRARVAVGSAPHGQRPRREPGALRALPAQAEQLQRDGERVQAGRRHVCPAGLHRRPVRRPRQGLPADRQEPRGGAQGDQRRQAGHGARRRGLRGSRLRAVLRHRALHPRLKSTPSSTGWSRSACSRCSS